MHFDAHQDIDLLDAMMPSVRTTVTLDPDVAAQIQRDMRERGVSFKQALNDAIRVGRHGGETAAVTDFPTYAMGRPRVDLTKALQLAGQLEDEELARRLAEGR